MADPGASTLALVLAGGPGSRLDVLTDRRAKPAMRFGGTFRLIDIPLTNCRHSRIADVWVVQQYQPHSLVDHLGNGRPWDLDRTSGGLKVLHPHLGTEGEGFHEGTADAVHNTMPFIEEHDPDNLVVLSSDHVYLLDYREVLEEHTRTGADLTIVTTRLDRSEAHRFGVVELDGDGGVTSFVRKPDDPPTDIVSTEVFVFSPRALEQALGDLVHDEGEDALEDLGDELLPRMVAGGKVREFRFEGYWRDVGTLSGYLEGHLDLLGDPPTLDLSAPTWPLLSQPSRRPGAYIGRGADVEDSLIAPGARVHGRVRRSIVGPGVTIAAGADIDKAVLLDDVAVGEHATIRCAIVDERARIGDGATVGDEVDVSDSDAIAVVGAGADVSGEVAAGSRIEPADR